MTLDADTEALVRQRMRQRRISFKQAINDAIRDGAGNARRQRPSPTRTVSMGVPTVNLDRALQIAAELEDDELVRKMRSGS